MPIEIRRFGVGHRRPDGPAGSVGLTGQLLHSDGRGTVSELAFARSARIEPHSNPNTTYFIVVEGGGWVGVGDERTRIAAGEAAVWPPDTVHAAWTEHSEMRAIVVELAGADDRGAVLGLAHESAPGSATTTQLPDARRVSPSEGSLAPPERATPHDRSEGEPV